MGDVSLGFRIIAALIVVVIAAAWAELQGVRAPWLLCAFALLVLAPTDRFRSGTTEGALADGAFCGLFCGVIASAAFGATATSSVVIGAALGLAVFAVELWLSRARR